MKRRGLRFRTRTVGPPRSRDRVPLIGCLLLVALPLASAGCTALVPALGTRLANNWDVKGPVGPGKCHPGSPITVGLRRGGEARGRFDGLRPADPAAFPPVDTSGLLLLSTESGVLEIPVAEVTWVRTRTAGITLVPLAVVGALIDVWFWRTVLTDFGRSGGG